MRIRTLHVRGYRHFDDVVVHDLGDINVFAGPNNAGKTSLLRAVRETLDLWDMGQRRPNSPQGPFVNFGLPMESCPGKRYRDRNLEHSCAVGFKLSDEYGTSILLRDAYTLQVWGPSEVLRKLGIRDTRSHGALRFGALPGQ
jgi:hypothetical protein